MVWRFTDLSATGSVAKKRIFLDFGWIQASFADDEEQEETTQNILQQQQLFAALPPGYF